MVTIEEVKEENQKDVQQSVWDDCMNNEILKYIIKKGTGTDTASLSTVVR